MKKEKSCGIIVFDDDKVLLIKSQLGHYGFPKGHVEENETEEETALREVKEETNCDVRIIDGYRDMITYSPKADVIKDVVYFIGNPITKDLKAQEEEVSELFFISINDAFDKITYLNEKEAFTRAKDYYYKK